MYSNIRIHSNIWCVSTALKGMRHLNSIKLLSCHTTHQVFQYIRIYSVIRCANSNIESPNLRIIESSNHERIGKYSLYRIIESPNSESWRIFLIFDLSNIESPNRFGDRILNQDSMIRYSVIEYRILRITEYSMIRYPYNT